MSSPAGSLGSGGDRGSAARRAWRVVRFPLALLVLAYIALVIYRIPAVMNKQKSAEAVTRIQAQHLTIADIDGSHLPPQPDPSQVDATVAGVDANGNGIRDDVELAIFKKYPNDIKLRAAELQYAMALQLEYTEVFDSETLVADLRQQGRAYLCLSDQARAREVKALMANTQARTAYVESLLSHYMTSYGLDSRGECDIQA